MKGGVTPSRLVTSVPGGGAGPGPGSGVGPVGAVAQAAMKAARLKAAPSFK
jgi:hypothetical protein